MNVQLAGGVVLLLVAAGLALLIGTEPLVFPFGSGNANVYVVYAVGLAGLVLLLSQRWRRGQTD